MTRRPPPIAHHRMLSDGRSAALLTPGGEIDWWCWPRMHSRPLCWTLLDPAGGFARWGGGRHAELRGAPAGTTARRTLRIGDDLVELWDGMLPGRRTSGLVRLVRNRDRDLDVCHELALGGFDGPRARWCGNRAEIDGDVVLRVTGGITQIVDGTARTRVRAGRGQWALLSIAESDADPDIDDTITRLQAYERAGAEVLYAPGLRSGEEIRAVTESTSKPLNVLAHAGLTMREIVDAGGRRISLGGALTWVAVEAMATAATKMRDEGDFSSLDVPPARIKEWLGG